MRFRVRVEMWLESSGLGEAESAAAAMEEAALAAVEPSVVPDPEGGGLTRTSLEPMDDEAAAALATEGLGPGITSVRFGGDAAGDR